MNKDIKVEARIMHGKDNHALFEPCDFCDEVIDMFRMEAASKKVKSKMDYAHKAPRRRGRKVK